MISATSASTWIHSPWLKQTLNSPNPNQNRSFRGYIRFWDCGQCSPHIKKNSDTFATAERNPKCPKPEPKSLVSWLHLLLRLSQKSLYHQQALGHIRHGLPTPWKFCKLEPKTALHPTPLHNPTSLMNTCSRNAKLRPFASNTSANQLICKP